jgi:hypothetical protein
LIVSGGWAARYQDLFTNLAAQKARHHPKDPKEVHADHRRDHGVHPRQPVRQGRVRHLRPVLGDSGRVRHDLCFQLPTVAASDANSLLLAVFAVISFYLAIASLRTDLVLTVIIWLIFIGLVVLSVGAEAQQRRHHRGRRLDRPGLRGAGLVPRRRGHHRVRLRPQGAALRPPATALGRRPRPRAAPAGTARGGQAQPALGEQPARDHVGWPVHAQVHPASAHPGGGQERRGMRRGATHAERPGSGTGRQHGKGGVPGRHAEAFRLGQPRAGGRPRPGDQPGQPSSCRRAAGGSEARQARTPPSAIAGRQLPQLRAPGTRRPARPAH